MQIFLANLICSGFLSVIILETPYFSRIEISTI